MISEVSYLSRNRKKREILKILDKPKTPTQIGKLLNISRSSASQMLLAMEEKKYVKCLNPKDRMARYYQATDKGLKTLKELENLEK